MRERRALTTDEVNALLGKLQEPCRTTVILILLTGMRIGEVLALRWGKIDWQRQAIIVDEGLYEGEVSTPKTESGVRILPMTKLLFSALLEWKTGKTVGADNFIFPSAVGTGFCRRNLSNRFLKPAAAAAGIGNVSWHMLRRTHSTWLKDVGATPDRRRHETILAAVAQLLSRLLQCVPVVCSLQSQRVQLCTSASNICCPETWKYRYS